MNLLIARFYFRVRSRMDPTYPVRRAISRMSTLSLALSTLALAFDSATQSARNFGKAWEDQILKKESK